ncbi:MAG: M48 family metallopeptidase [Cyanobacteria bacterium]|nr:M48 family metallopeptidase [Cyanobacteriota bacterium]
MQLWNQVRRAGRRWLYGAIALTMAVGLIAVTPKPSEAGLLDLIFGGIQYIQLSNMGDAGEMDLGRRIDASIRQQVPIYTRNADMVSYIQGIGNRLAATSGRPPDDDFQYTFQIVEDDSVNAFATAGGFAYVNTGLIREAETEAELAGVMAHEIGHIVGRHVINRMRDQVAIGGIAGALGVNQDALVGIGVDLALNLPNSRSAETEADNLGFDNMGAAGYDQAGFITFMQKLGGSGSPEFLSTHPNPDNRVANLQSRYNNERTATAVDGSSTESYQARISKL